MLLLYLEILLGPINLLEFEYHYSTTLYDQVGPGSEKYKVNLLLHKLSGQIWYLRNDTLIEKKEYQTLHITNVQRENIIFVWWFF